MNGIIIVNKEKDYTSRDVVNIISKHFNTKKVGHTGTLDPLATGVLVVCTGQATKLAELLTATDKEYIAEVLIGRKTDTLDITGTILEEKEQSINKEALLKVLSNMIGTYEQVVPIYSAVKVQGKKLYEYARNNEFVELPKKEVQIKELELLSMNDTTFTFRTVVSKGTYIRSLINDICEQLQILGTMSNLKRTKQGKFDIKESYTLDDIKNNQYKIIPTLEVLDNYLTIEVDDFIENKIKNGSILENRYDREPIVFTNQNKDVLAIYKTYEKDPLKIKPWKVF